jgi:predicted TIM-barrel fold metal-dependent hydrolase
MTPPTTQVIDRAAGDKQAKSVMAIADCDIHVVPGNYEKELYPFLAKRWQDYLATYGTRPRQGYGTGPAYPKGQPDAARRDAYPPNGGKPGSNLAFMREHHLDPLNIQFGTLNPLRTGQGLQNLEFGAAYCKAINDWQVAEWTSKELRVKGSVVVTYEDTVEAVKEIEARAGDPNFAQVLLLSRSSEPFGQKRYWPVFEAAAAAGFPVGIHAFGYGGVPVTGGGWPSYYLEEMIGHAQAQQAVLMSMTMEGVFARIPALKVVLIEAGFAWLPSLLWRMDKLWVTMRDEVPHLTRKPSEYVREQVWLTTQPMEEPEFKPHLLDTIGWIGWDRLLFATDYPHWDFDHPELAMPIRVGDEQKQKFFLQNALDLYKPRPV